MVLLGTGSVSNAAVAAECGGIVSNYLPDCRDTGIEGPAFISGSHRSICQYGHARRSGCTSRSHLLSDGRRRGHSAGRVMAAWALFLVFDYAGLLFAVTLGLIVLDRRNIIHWTELVAFSILISDCQHYPAAAGPGDEIAPYLRQVTGSMRPVCQPRQPFLQPQRYRQ
jgi:hypothetical protein